MDLLCWTALASPLDIQTGRHYLDLACGNGVTAFDFSANLIEKARARLTWLESLISYHVDATSEQQLLSLSEQTFDAALSNMALFRSLPRLLKPGGLFVFSIAHPAFNSSSFVHMLDVFIERAFLPDAPQTGPLGWGGKFREIPPVRVARFRRKLY